MLPSRITDKVDRSGGIDACWPWRGSHTSGGRPQVNLNGRPWYVYRLLYEEEIGPIPDSLTLDHAVCDNGWCCNPHHCKPATNGANVGRALAARWAGRTACPQGHPYDQYRHTTPGGYSYCRACQQARVNAWKRKQRASRPSRVHGTETHCPQGHPYDAANTWLSKEGHRQCKTCKRQRVREWKQRQKQRPR